MGELAIPVERGRGRLGPNDMHDGVDDVDLELGTTYSKRAFGAGECETQKRVGERIVSTISIPGAFGHVTVRILGRGLVEGFSIYPNTWHQKWW